MLNEGPNLWNVKAHHETQKKQNNNVKTAAGDEQV